MLGRLLGWFRMRGQPAARVFRGKPRIRREKAYSADSGYVYQYTYEGYCDTQRAGLDGRDYVFRCTSDRSSRIDVTIFAPSERFADWERDAERNLTEVERYAVVKMRLFALFDGSEHLLQDVVEVLTLRDVSEHVEALDL